MTIAEDFSTVRKMGVVNGDGEYSPEEIHDLLRRVRAEALVSCGPTITSALAQRPDRRRELS